MTRAFLSPRFLLLTAALVALAVFFVGDTPPSAQAQSSIRPAPAGMAGIHLGFYLYWHGVTGATGYEIEIRQWSGSAWGNWSSVSYTRTAQPAIVTGLTNEVKYQWRIRGVRGGGQFSEWSLHGDDYDVAYNRAAKANGEGQPNQPILESVTPGAGQIDVSWTAGPVVSGGAVTSYRVYYRCRDSDNVTCLDAQNNPIERSTGALPASATSTTLRNLTPGTEYEVWMRSFSGNTKSISTFLETVTPNAVIVQGTAGMTVSPTSLTVPVGGQECYQITPATKPTAALTITATSSAPGKATVQPLDTSDRHVAGSEANWKVGQSRCVKGVATGTATISHAVASDDSNYNEITTDSVSVTVTAAATKPTVRFLHTEIRAVEGNTDCAANPALCPFGEGSVHNYQLKKVKVKLWVAPTPATSEQIMWVIPYPSAECRPGTNPCFNPGYTGTARFNVDFRAEWLEARQIWLSPTNNSAEFEVYIRSDDQVEDDENVRIHLVNQRFVNGRFLLNNNVCVGACDSNQYDIDSHHTNFIIIDDDTLQSSPDGAARPTDVTLALGEGNEAAAARTVGEDAGAVPLTATLDVPAPHGGISLRLFPGPDDTATRNADYAMPDSIDISAGQRSGTASITITDDSVDEADETANITAFAALFDGDLTGRAVLTITDDDPCANCGTEGDQGSVPRPPDTDGEQEQTTQEKYADLITKMKEWRDDPCCASDKVHTDRWDRALLAFGETVADTTLTPMTADEAQALVDRGWTRWAEVTTALREIESGAQQQQQGTPNRAPTVAKPLADISLEGPPGWRTISLSGVFHDPDGDDLIITVVSSNYGVASMYESVFVDGSTLTVLAMGTGTATITVTAEDADGNRVSDSFEVTVTPPAS